MFNERNKYTRRKMGFKKRNPEKVVMDKFYHSKIFRNNKNMLNVIDADDEIESYLRGDDDVDN
jgi:hypothetical protein